MEVLFSLPSNKMYKPLAKAFILRKQSNYNLLGWLALQCLKGIGSVPMQMGSFTQGKSLLLKPQVAPSDPSQLPSLTQLIVIETSLKSATKEEPLVPHVN